MDLGPRFTEGTCNETAAWELVMTYQLYKFFAPLILLFENPTTWIVLALSIIAVCGMVVVRFGNSSTADWNKVLRMAAASVGFLALVSTT